MTSRSRKYILLAGAGLILLTNAVALGGAAYNRYGDPESTLRLSERELRPADGWGVDRENSGMALDLRWRTLGKDVESANDFIEGRYAYRGAPTWLNQRKLAALGFNTSSRKAPGGREYDAISAKQVFLVLELDGAAYQAMLERVRQLGEQAKTAHTGSANVKDVERKVKNAEERLAREETSNSRLFVIDAGLDAEALRAQYPDRTRYAIVRGQVRPYWDRGANGVTELVGHVVGTSAGEINVPLGFQTSFARANERTSRGENAQLPKRDITVAFGRRLEPWITAVANR